MLSRRLRAHTHPAGPRPAALAIGGRVICALPCIFHKGFSIEIIQGRLEMTLPPTARPHPTRGRRVFHHLYSRAGALRNADGSLRVLPPSLRGASRAHGRTPPVGPRYENMTVYPLKGTVYHLNVTVHPRRWRTSRSASRRTCWPAAWPASGT